MQRSDLDILRWFFFLASRKYYFYSLKASLEIVSLEQKISAVRFYAKQNAGFDKAGVSNPSHWVPLSCSFWMDPCSKTPESHEWLMNRSLPNLQTCPGGNSLFLLFRRVEAGIHSQVAGQWHSKTEVAESCNREIWLHLISFAKFLILNLTPRRGQIAFCSCAEYHSNPLLTKLQIKTHHFYA